ncbi:MAG: UDP-N-acetylmuramoyl-L-alanyl-D-glutamate--2,6-diaminopimelate ligase, partial [Desulfovibrio sp.]|nr:UDP-N-acetylmuramoyl-L-alanyl-D-glutamate--2,6-diaminopimelate ligase [Desulfovibrio sp.]
MLLSELLMALSAADLPFTLVGTALDPWVEGVCLDSRQAGRGMLFAACPGVANDGHDYLVQAQEAGAAAALVQRPRTDLAMPQVVVADSRRACAHLAQAFHGDVSAHQVLVGLTGTNGKTTISYLLEAILGQRGPVGVIGTVEARFNRVRRPAAMTTPEAPDLAALLAEMAGLGVGQVVMEVSSHALAQHRVDGCRFDLALFTNLSRDHLDYHADLEDYFAAKRRLFAQLLPASRRAGKDPKAVICLDDPRGQGLADLCRDLGLTVWTYGLTSKAMVHAAQSRLSLKRSELDLAWPGGELAISTPLVGSYNLQNILGAAAAGLAL